MARGTSIQKPTTLLTIKMSQENAASSGSNRSDIIIITDNGDVTGELRVATGNPQNTTLTAPSFNNISVPIYPVGAIIYFAGPVPPDGYLNCNGGEYRAIDYPELYNYLKSGSSWTGQTKPTFSVKAETDTSSPDFGKQTQYFTVPNYTNSGYTGGGLFVRNLNNTNSALNDYTETIRNESSGSYKNTVSATSSLTNRTHGHIQNSTFAYHNHGFQTTTVGFTNEDHFHHYYGSPGATNGHQLGYTNKASGFTNYKIFSMDKYATTDDNNDPALTHDSLNTVGTHIHSGFLGFGQNYSDTEHNTYHNSNTAFDNSDETRPKNYSLLFCIKY